MDLKENLMMILIRFTFLKLSQLMYSSYATVLKLQSYQSGGI